ncbi:MAG: TonB-dependent receptor [Thermodesulfovibrio aggregans]|uniref:TonB-dependent receptor n=1 Tax=Thermodesulfovibrio aggregans TaxID=86166 RepID=A0A2J6WMB2_9BACT|nr:MAG: TonB-dependent receptor [Thermodesulfovibrio aggregans]
MELKAPKTIDQALNDISGVFVRRGKGLMDTLSAITLRGIPEQKRTLILMDGMVLNNPYTGEVRMGGYYPEDLERVEVVKGPFSSLYGGYAMGGVVNFITKMPEKREFTFKSGYGSSWSRGEAMDDLRRVYISYGDKLWDKLSIFLSYGWQGTNGYPSDLNVPNTKPPTGITGYEITSTRDGKTAYIIGDKGDNRWWDDGITIKTQYEFTKDTKIKFSFMRNRYEYNYDEPHTYLRNAAGNPVWTYTVGRTTIYENSFLPGGGGRIQNTYSLGFETKLYKELLMKLNLSYLDTEKNWYVTTLSQATRLGCGLDPTRCGYVSNTPSEVYMADLQFSLPIFNNQILTFGSSFRHGYANTKEKYLRDWRDENSTTTLKYESKGKDKTYAIFIQDEIMLLNNLTAYIGFRQDWWKTYDGYVNDVGKAGYPKEYPSKSKSSFSPKFAIVYKPFETTTLRGSVGKAFRAPTVYELYRTWTSSTGITYAGNPQLDPETVTSWDIGVEQKLWKGAKVSLTYFENYMKDLIYRKTVTSNYKEYVNVGKAESRGVEFEFEQRFEKWLRLFGNFTYTDSEIKENNANPSTVGCRLTYTPLWRANVGAEFEKSGFSAMVVGRYVGKWFSEDDNSDRVNNVYGSYDPYFVVDGRIAYQITKFAKLSFSVDNIFDRKYYQYYRAPGRSWFTELTLKF